MKHFRNQTGSAPRDLPKDQPSVLGGGCDKLAMSKVRPRLEINSTLGEIGVSAVRDGLTHCRSRNTTNQREVGRLLAAVPPPTTPTCCPWSSSRSRPRCAAARSCRSSGSTWTWSGAPRSCRRHRTGTRVWCRCPFERSKCYRTWYVRPGRCFRMAGIEDVRFHDLRHEATTRFFNGGRAEKLASKLK